MSTEFVTSNNRFVHLREIGQKNSLCGAASMIPNNHPVWIRLNKPERDQFSIIDSIQAAGLHRCKKCFKNGT